MQPNVGIDHSAAEKISDNLAQFLKDSYALMLKSHNYHWNVTGHHFQQLHNLFEEHYEDLFEAVDEIAELIRQLGFLVPGGLKDYAAASNVKDGKEGSTWQEMVKDALADHEALVVNMRNWIQPAQEAGDEVTVGLIVDRMGFHEKQAWFLRSLVQEVKQSAEALA